LKAPTDEGASRRAAGTAAERAGRQLALALLLQVACGLVACSLDAVLSIAAGPCVLEERQSKCHQRRVRVWVHCACDERGGLS
jgi:hypothetical protein